MHDQGVHVVSLGASTPVGRSAWSNAAAVRAGISGFGQHPYMTDRVGEPVRLACAPWLDGELSGVERLSALLLPAVGQALEVLPRRELNTLRVGLLLAMPSPRPGLPGDMAQPLVDSVATRHGTAFSQSIVFPVGHAAGLVALEAAQGKLESGEYDACVVAGVDSYADPETLEWLEECGQLHGAGPLNNAWGFIPGEAAGALLLMRGEVAQSLGIKTLARVLGVATAVESKCIKTDTVCIGEGLTVAFRSALRGLPDDALVTDVYCDMNGEPYRADEYGFACLRTKEAFVSASDFVAPADCLGDTGAASGPLHIGLAAIAGAKKYANGAYGFVCASSEGGERGAALMAV